MGQVIDFNSLEPHYAKEVICINCKKRWIAVYECATSLKKLECPKCKKQGYTIWTGQEFDDNGKPK